MRTYEKYMVEFYENNAKNKKKREERRVTLLYYLSDILCRNDIIFL